MKKLSQEVFRSLNFSLNKKSNNQYMHDLNTQSVILPNDENSCLNDKS